jgi:hypothetical protein
MSYYLWQRTRTRCGLFGAFVEPRTESVANDGEGQPQGHTIHPDPVGYEVRNGKCHEYCEEDVCKSNYIRYEMSGSYPEVLPSHAQTIYANGSDAQLVD